MRNPKFKVGDQVAIEGRTDENFITEVDVQPCSCSSHERSDDDEIWYSINDRFNVKESDLEVI